MTKRTIGVPSLAECDEAGDADAMSLDPRMDLETRCVVCNAARYDDVNGDGAFDGATWRCGSHSGKPSLSARTAWLLKQHDDGILVNKHEYAKLLREWIYLA